MNSITELIFRFVYFKLYLRNFLENREKKSLKNAKKITLQQIETIFKKQGIKKGDTIMVHSSLSAIDAGAEELVRFLLDYIGEDGNVMMPTHPNLKRIKEILIYDVQQSKSRVGYLTEFFRKCKGVNRSLHPFSSVAVWGKDQDWILMNNLTNNNPLPHGENSPYHKLSLLKGTVVCIGVTAKNRATIKHCAEELMDRDFPVKNFFIKQKVEIFNNGKCLGIFTCRLADLNKSQLFVAKSKIEKEWLNAGILNRYKVNYVPVEFVDARECVDFMTAQIKIGNTSYPFAPKK